MYKFDSTGIRNNLKVEYNTVFLLKFQVKRKKQQIIESRRHCKDHHAHHLPDRVS